MSQSSSPLPAPSPTPVPAAGSRSTGSPIGARWRPLLVAGAALAIAGVVRRDNLADAVRGAVAPAPAADPLVSVPVEDRHGLSARLEMPLRTLLDEQFTAGAGNWPNDPQGVAWVARGPAGSEYHLFAREPGQFVAIGAPIAEPLLHVAMTARFHKAGGPAGGGYGLIVRDQGPGPRDGHNQGGRYYVMEVGDRGEVGMWQRNGDEWLAIVPWSASTFVKPDQAVNELRVEAIDRDLTFLVNGVVVGSYQDLEGMLPAGGVGIFAGGDFNEVVLERLTIQVPR